MARREVTVGTPNAAGRCIAGDNIDKLTLGKQGLERVSVRSNGFNSNIVEEVVMDDEGWTEVADYDKTSAWAPNKAQVTSCDYRLLKQMQMTGGGGDDSGQVKTEDSRGTVVAILRLCDVPELESVWKNSYKRASNYNGMQFLSTRLYRKKRRKIWSWRRLWLVSGGTEWKHGVGVLLCNDLSLQRFVAISPRLHYVEADGHSQKLQ